MILRPATVGETVNNPLVGDILEDVKQTLEHERFGAQQAIVAYVYGKHTDTLYCIIGKGNDILVTKLMDDHDRPVGARHLLELEDLYQVYFIELNNLADNAVHQQLREGIFDCWRRIYRSFIEHFMNMGKQVDRMEVLCKMEIEIESTRIFFNLPLCHNMWFRYLKWKENRPLYFTMVTDDSIYGHFTGMLDLPCPSMSNMILLTGGITPVLDFATDAELQAAIEAREPMLEAIRQLIKNAGGDYRNIQGVDDFRDLFSICNSRNVIQLLTHHKDGWLDTKDGSRMPLSGMVTAARDLAGQGQLHQNIVLDAITCENNTAFQSLKQVGLKRIYYSYNLLSIDLSLYQLYELYSGDLAKALGWKFPYIDGSSHLHIIYSDISRAQYITMNIKCQVRVPGPS